MVSNDHQTLSRIVVRDDTHAVGPNNSFNPMPLRGTG